MYVRLRAYKPLKAASFYSVLWEWELFNKLLYNLNVLLFYSRNSWKGERGRVRDKERWEFFNKALACPLCGLYCWIKTGFHLSLFLSLYINLPSTNSVSSSAMRHTLICKCVCAVEWEAGCPFGRQQYTEAPLRKNWTIIELLRNTLTSVWNTSLFSLYQTQTHTHTCTHTGLGWAGLLALLIPVSHLLEPHLESEACKGLNDRTDRKSLKKTFKSFKLQVLCISV